jgi:formyltetrahydrofolate synthetase
MYLSKRINNYKEINLEFIINKNIFGLSNTAIKLKNLKKFNLPNNLIALDWYIFSKLLVEGKKAIFTNKTITFYRQHKNNIIGMKKMNNKLLKKILKVKKKHYRAISKISNYFKIKLNKLKNQENNKKIDYPVWWEQN